MTRHLKIVHCLRAPVGGLFRHVCDLAQGQAANGHQVGIVCDARTGDDLTERALVDAAGHCVLGVHRHKMHRSLSPTDISTAIAIRSRCRRLGADIVHGHGAKGGAYARFAALGRDLKAFYTPHGGSLHYSKDSLSGRVFLTLERYLGYATSGLIFESRYGLDTYRRKIGSPLCDARVIHNGLRRSEFEPVPVGASAADFLYVGELRLLKGVDVFLHALSNIAAEHNATAVIVGSGPDTIALKTLADDLDLANRVEFPGAMPARQAFALGHTLVVPSRAESFPYIVLESLAAAKPTIATSVGGIPEIFGTSAHLLVPPDDIAAMTKAMRDAIEARHQGGTTGLNLAKEVSHRFAIEAMVTAIDGFYQEVLEGRCAPEPAASVPGPAAE